MKIIDTGIDGLKIAETAPIADHRGHFARWFCARELSALLNGKNIAQINQAKSLKSGCVRGMHFQKSPHAEIKFVRCIKGRLWDVALDLRAGSPTFMQWHGEELTEDNNRMLIVPEGFAHGYQTLEPETELIYFNTAFYEPSAEGGVHYADPLASIKWPLAPTDLSQRDEKRPFLEKNFKGLAHG